LLDSSEGIAVAHVRYRWPPLDLLVDGFIAVAGIGVIAQKLRSASAALLFELLEEIRHGLGVITGAVHNDGARSVSLRFIRARIFHQYGARSNLNAQACKISSGASRQHGPGNACQYKSEE